MTQVLDRTVNVIRKVFDEPELIVTPEMMASDVEGWDSLSHIRVIVALEKEFRIRFTASEALGCKNIGELVERIKAKIV